MKQVLPMLFSPRSPAGKPSSATGWKPPAGPAAAAAWAAAAGAAAGPAGCMGCAAAAPPPPGAGAGIASAAGAAPKWPGCVTEAPPASEGSAESADSAGQDAPRTACGGQGTRWHGIHWHCPGAWVECALRRAAGYTPSMRPRSTTPRPAAAPTSLSASNSGSYTKSAQRVQYSSWVRRSNTTSWPAGRGGARRGGVR